MQFTTAGDAELVRIFGLFHAQGHVVDQLLVQTLQNVAGGHELAFFTGERRGVDLESHVHGRLVNGERRQGFDGMLSQMVSEIFSSPRPVMHMMSPAASGHFGTGQAVAHMHLTDLAGTRFAVGTDDGDRLVGLDATTVMRPIPMTPHREL